MIVRIIDDGKRGDSVIVPEGVPSRILFKHICDVCELKNTDENMKMLERLSLAHGETITVISDEPELFSVMDKDTRRKFPESVL